jgi:excisionase family DNA binding protein
VKVLRIDQQSRSSVEAVTDEIERLLQEGKAVAVTVAEDNESVSPQQAADRLGFSRQHVVRLIEAGEIDAHRLTGSSYWRIPVDALLAFEQQRAEARRVADEHSRALDAADAPLE